MPSQLFKDQVAFILWFVTLRCNSYFYKRPSWIRRRKRVEFQGLGASGMLGASSTQAQVDSLHFDWLRFSEEGGKLEG